MERKKILINIALTGIVSLMLVSIARMSQTTGANVENYVQPAENLQLQIIDEEFENSEKQGQVIVTNLDSLDKTLKIVNVDTDVEFIVSLNSNGLLTYFLPLGEYTITEINLSDPYIHNPLVHEISLSVSSSTEAFEENFIPTVEIALSNEYYASMIASAEEIVKPNPQTDDKSIIKLISTIILSGVLLATIVTYRQLKRKMYK